MSAVALSAFDLAIAAVLILINGAVSLAFRLGLERQLAIVTARMVVQLAVIGFVLKFVFAQSSPLWTIGLAAITRNRQSLQRLPLLLTRRHRRFPRHVPPPRIQCVDGITARIRWSNRRSLLKRMCLRVPIVKRHQELVHRRHEELVRQRHGLTSSAIVSAAGCFCTRPLRRFSVSR